MATTFSTPSHFTRTKNQPFSVNHEFELLEGVHRPFSSRHEGHTFRNYPGRCGFTLKDLEQGIVPGTCRLADVAYFLQEWLFFGLAIGIAELPKLPLASIDLKFTGSGGRQYLTISTLPFILRYWIANEGLAYGPDEADDRLKVATSYLNLARNVAAIFSSIADETISRQNVHSTEREAALALRQVLLASVLLQQELIKILRRVYTGYIFIGQSVRFNDDGKVAKIPYPLAQIRACHVPSSLSKELCLQAGWCPCEVDALPDRCGDYATTQLFHLSKMSRPLKDHTSCHGPSCAMPQRTIWTQHTRAGCGCGVVNMPATEDQIKNIARAGGIPTITVCGSQAKGLRISISTPGALDELSSPTTPSKFSAFFRRKSSSSDVPQQRRPSATSQKRPFVIVSYARAEKLESTAHHSLNYCQLERLQELVNTLYPPKQRPVPFWLDVLCVPGSSRPDSVTTRTELLQSIPDTFKEADRVLVVDTELSLLPIETDPEELLARIYHCQWAKALWALQEAALPDKVCFQLRDGVVEVDELVRKYRKYHYGMLEGASYGMQDKKMQISYHERFRSSIHYMNQFWSYRDKDMGFGFDDVIERKSDHVIVKGLRIMNEMATYSLGNMFQTTVDWWNDLRSIPRSPSNQQRVLSVMSQLAFRTNRGHEDEPDHLAILLGIHPKIATEVPRGQPAERTVVNIWQAYEMLPSSLIFGPEDRIASPGFTWTPDTLVGTGKPAVQPNIESFGTVSREPPGFFIRLPGLRLQLWGIHTSINRTYLWFEIGEMTVRVTLQSTNRTWQSSLRHDRPLCLITHKIVDNQMSQFPAVLVSVLDVSGQTMWVQYESAATIESSEWLKDEPDALFTAEALDTNTMWHLR